MVVRGWVLAMALVVLVAAQAARACPMCSETLPNERPAAAGADPTLDAAAGGASAGQHASLAEGFFYSILLMLAVPFLTFGGFVTMLAIAVRKNGRALAANPHPSLSRAA